MRPRGRAARSTLFATSMIAAGVLASACGGRSPVTPGPPPPPPPPRVTFNADSANPGIDAIALGLSTSTADAFTLALSAAGVTDLYGYGVDIAFDPAIVAFEGASAGSFFDGAGITVTTQVVEGPPGTLVIGQSRVGGVPGVSGSGTLLTLEFVSVVAGSTAFELENEGAFDSTGAALSIEFFGGTATVPNVAR